MQPGGLQAVGCCLFCLCYLAHHQAPESLCWLLSPAAQPARLGKYELFNSYFLHGCQLPFCRAGSTTSLSATCRQLPVHRESSASFGGWAAIEEQGFRRLHLQVQANCGRQPSHTCCVECRAPALWACIGTGGGAI